ncbi:MAG: S8 family serine peptidase [Planctomycetes bacterium]|nr:S8 family serine peptidase [Planctomycetota bacterium]
MLLPLLLLLASTDAPGVVVPRIPSAKEPIEIPVLTAPTQRVKLYVKFADALRVRATADGSIHSEFASLDAARTELARSGATCRRAIQLDDQTLTQLEHRARATSGQESPDLAGILEARVDLPIGELATLARRLQTFDEVEYAELFVEGTPPPGDIAPTTPDLASSQTYRNANPGINAVHAHALSLRGEGIRIADCEYGWNYAHEDLVDVALNPEPFQTIDPGVIANGWDEHGTAAFGELAAATNAYGCSGLTPNATFTTFTEWSVQEGPRRLTCITNAIATSKAGDIVLLEMQTVGAGGSYVPAEYSLSVWNVVKTGSNAGVVVVGAAGNGNQDLDSSTYAPYMARGDSGAILVGAGSADTAHSKLSFSTFGSRVDLQGWGGGVFTLGYGSFASYGGDKNQRYASGFSGTSSASPIVTAAAVLVQQAAKQRQFAPMTGVQIRNKLIATGIAQGSGGEIGPLPNLQPAIDSIAVTWTALGFALAGQNGLPKLSGAGSLSAGTTWQIKIESGKPNAPCAFVLGASQANLPFYGGTLVPTPNTVLGFALNATGALTLAGTTPPGLPSGANAVMQVWIADPAAVAGASATNALVATAP